MASQPIIMVVDPAHYDVHYVINPWMHPDDWARDPEGHKRDARASFEALRAALQGAGARVDVIPGVPNQPDMVFPANAAVVLDRRAIVARFACRERQGEEQPNLAALQAYIGQGLLDEVALFPEGVFQEGAGDAIWDRARQLFWAGYGQRSVRQAIDDLTRRRLMAASAAGGAVLLASAAFARCCIIRLRSAPSRWRKSTSWWRPSSAWKPARPTPRRSA